MEGKIEITSFVKPPIHTAKDLLGRTLSTRINGQITSGIIVETEVYRGGKRDNASHAHYYKNTNRTRIMFEEGGYCYIYLIYGRYYQLCVTSSPKNEPDAILIRSLEPKEGIDIMQKRRESENNLTNGPGRLTQALGIDKSLYGEKINGDNIWISKERIKVGKIAKTTRIGISYASKYAQSLKWRFYIKESNFVSKKDKS